MITIKTFKQIYDSIKNKFYSKTKLDVERGSVIDMFLSAISDEIEDVYTEIENNKKPYLFTEQTGKELDSTGAFVSCTRYANESDENYFYRMINWNRNNATCNSTAIANRFANLEYSKAANYVAYTKGIGTATIYLTPLSYDEDARQEALEEAQQKLSAVINPSSLVTFEIPDPKYVKLVAYLDVKDGYNKESIKNNIISRIKSYINSINPGSAMYLGTINKIGMSIDEVEYFNIVQIYIDDEEATDFEVLQTIDTKLLFEEIIWWDIES